jgi:hypothetical protein
VITVYILYYLGLLFLYPLPSDAFMVPLFTNHSMKTLRKRFDSMPKCKAFFARISLVIMRVMIRNSKALYRHLRARNVMVVVWVLNEP